tara:strand:- start:933 stop:1115 length:183 start_codon:yes stop_codon:yes gene_type:complete
MHLSFLFLFFSTWLLWSFVNPDLRNYRKAIFNDPEEVVVVEQPPAVDPNMQQQQEQQEAN